MLRQTALFFAALAISAPAAADQCFSFFSSASPFDYFNPQLHKRHPVHATIPSVTSVHFTPNVRNLIAGNTSTIAGDLDYTLRAIPNHLPALQAAARYENRARNFGVKSLGKYETGLPVSADCYLRRALKFTPDHPQIYVVYGINKMLNEDYSGAVEMIKRALDMGYESAEGYYNLGLAYYYSGQYKKAQENAIQAYDRGYPLPGLKNMLKKKGHWETP